MREWKAILTGALVLIPMFATSALADDDFKTKRFDLEAGGGAVISGDLQNRIGSYGGRAEFQFGSNMHRPRTSFFDPLYDIDVGGNVGGVHDDQGKSSAIGGYHLTYSIPLRPKSDLRIDATNALDVSPQNIRANFLLTQFHYVGDKLDAQAGIIPFGLDSARANQVQGYHSGLRAAAAVRLHPVVSLGAAVEAAMTYDKHKDAQFRYLNPDEMQASNAPMGKALVAEAIDQDGLGLLLRASGNVTLHPHKNVYVRAEAVYDHENAKMHQGANKFDCVQDNVTGTVSAGFAY